MNFEEYKNYLKYKANIPDAQISYYLGWVTQFFAFCNKNPGQPFDSTEVRNFLDRLANRCEDWQIKQARKAIELYRYLHRKHNDQLPESFSPPSSGAWKKAADEMTKRLRLKQRSYRTEKTYLNWLRDFYRFVDSVPPERIEDPCKNISAKQPARLELPSG